MNKRAKGEIRVVAPSSCLPRAEKPSLTKAQKRLKSLGYQVSFGAAVSKSALLGTANIQDRVDDIHSAYLNPNVRGVIALTGGWSANELLPFIDWNIIRGNPKPFIGYSDITVLINAFYAKTGQMNLLGPNFHTLGRDKPWRYMLERLEDMLETRSSWQLHPQKTWKVVQPGVSEARMIGGNLGSFYLLQGTPYQPRLSAPFILAIEDDDESGNLTSHEFSRRLESILQLPGARANIRGILVGRFQPTSKVKAGDLQAILLSKHLDKIPIVTGIDFGHMSPVITLPIGGVVRIAVGIDQCEITIQNYTQEKV